MAGNKDSATSKSRSIDNTPQAADDRFDWHEDELLASNQHSAGIITLDLLGNDKGGNAKQLFSLDAAGGNALLASDVANGVSAWERTAQGNLVRINKGKVELDIRPTLSARGLSSADGLAAGEALLDTFEYAIQLGNGTLSQASVSIDIRGKNDGPKAVNDHFAVAAGVESSLDLLANDSDIDALDNLRITQISTSRLGTAAISADGSKVKFSAGGAPGFERLTYTMSDGHGGTSTAEVFLVVGVSVDAGSTLALGGAGGDLLDFSGRSTNLTIAGLAGADTIVGGSGNDLILWSAGDGNDSVDGGAGWDHVLINMAPEAHDDPDADETLPGYAATPIPDTDYGDDFDGNGVTLPDDDAGPLPPSNPGSESDPVMDGGPYVPTYTYAAPLPDPEDNAGEPQSGPDDPGITYEVTVSASADGRILVNGPDFALSLDRIEDLSIVGGEDTDFLVENLDGTDLAQDTLFLTGNTGNNVMDASRIYSSRVVLNGLAGNDLLIGSRYADVLLGGTGNDILDGGLAGRDQLDGGDGVDVAAFVKSAAGVRVDFTAGFNPAPLAHVTHGLVNIEYFIGSSFNDTAWGDAGANRLEGRDGNDTLYGRDGIDTVDGGNGDDALYGDNGNDLVVGGYGNDTLYGGIGNDILDGQTGNDVLQGGAGDDRFFGGTGVDMASYADASSAVKVTLHDELTGRLFASDGSRKKALFQNTGNGYDQINHDVEGIIGSSFDDTLAGSSSNDVLNGANGNDILSGGAGDDLATGGNGSDRLWGNDGNDRLYGESGTDILSGGNGNDLLVGGPGNDTAYGGAGDDVLEGTQGYDTLYGEAGNDRFDLTVHRDLQGSYDGGSGEDTLVVRFSPASLLGSATLLQDLARFSDLLPVAGGEAGNFTFESIDLSLSSVEKLEVYVDSRLNVAPSFNADSLSLQVDEKQTAVTTLLASDAPLFPFPGGPSSPLSYRIHAGADADLFTVNAQSGVVTFREAPQYGSPQDANGDNVYQVSVLVSDGLGAYDLQDISIAVQQVARPGLTYQITNLVQNGSFEAPNTGGGLIANVSPGSTTITGWTVTSGNVDVLGSGWVKAAHRNQGVDMNGSEPGGIAQTLTTQAGAQYTTILNLSKSTYPSVQSLDAIVGVNAGGSSQNFTFSGPTSSANMRWATHSLDFVGTGADTVSLTSLAPGGSADWTVNGSGPYVDNVVVVETRVIDDFVIGAGGDVLDFSALLQSLDAPHDGAAFAEGWLQFDSSSGQDTVIKLDTTGGGDSFVPFITLTGVVLTAGDTANYLL